LPGSSAESACIATRPLKCSRQCNQDRVSPDPEQAIASRATGCHVQLFSDRRLDRDLRVV
jgi:hypothetical protein